MFEQFLTDHGIYEEYMSEFEKQRDVTFAMFFNSNYHDTYISGAFSWRNTKKGYDYWELINDMWVS